jgi:hypothetical protein
LLPAEQLVPERFLGSCSVNDAEKHHWKDRVGDFCVAQYLAKLNVGIGWAVELGVRDS